MSNVRIGDTMTNTAAEVAVNDVEVVVVVVKTNSHISLVVVNAFDYFLQQVQEIESQSKCGKSGSAGCTHSPGQY